MSLISSPLSPICVCMCVCVHVCVCMCVCVCACVCVCVCMCVVAVPHTVSRSSSENRVGGKPLICCTAVYLICSDYYLCEDWQLARRGFDLQPDDTPISHKLHGGGKTPCSNMRTHPEPLSHRRATLNSGSVSSRRVKSRWAFRVSQKTEHRDVEQKPQKHPRGAGILMIENTKQMRKAQILMCAWQFFFPGVFTEVRPKLLTLTVFLFYSIFVLLRLVFPFLSISHCFSLCDSSPRNK